MTDTMATFNEYNICQCINILNNELLIVFRVCGATIVNRTDEIREEDIGTECGLFEIEKIGDE